MKIILSTILVFLIAAGSQAHADEDEVCVTVYPGDTIEDRFYMGQSSDNKSAIYCYIPKPSFDGCTKGNGDIWYDPRFETVGNVSKILPDLQKEANSGADILCVKIVHPYYNHQSWMEIPGWEEYKAVFPDASKRTYADNLMIKNSNNIIQFLKDNNGKLWSDTPHKEPPIIAAIPAGLLPELASRDDVVKVDIWWKHFVIPSYIKHGYESKIDPLIQKEIEYGRQNCPERTSTTFENCPLLERNADGTAVVYIGISIETRAKQHDESLADFLTQNNQTVTHDGQWSISAYVAADFLPMLNARDDVHSIHSGNTWIQIDDPLLTDLYSDHLAVNLPSAVVSLEQDIQIKSPLQQVRSGVATQDVHCKNELILTILQDGRPVCLTESTALIMAERILGSRT